MSPSPDSRFTKPGRFEGEADAESSRLSSNIQSGSGNDESEQDHESSDDGSGLDDDDGAISDVLDPKGFSGPSEKVVKPLTPEALAAFKAEQDRAGVIYISRIPPGMQPAKVRHFMSAYGAIGRVYLQQEDAKRAYLRRKYTTTKKAHFTEGWVEFKDKKVARTVADMLNAQPIGGKKGTRWRDDIWTMKYLPRFKWSMLTEQVAHEAAVHAAKLRVELAQSKTEQHDYLKNVELARVLDKRAAKKKEKGEELKVVSRRDRKRPAEEEDDAPASYKKKRSEQANTSSHEKHVQQLDSVLGSIF